MVARPWSTTALSLCLAGLIVASLPMVATATEIKGAALKSVHSNIVKRHAGVKHMSVGQLAELQRTSPDKVLLLDVRETTEHTVSHIKGSIRVSPGTPVDVFMRHHGHKLHGRKVVLYCSVGERSSRLAKQIQQAGKTSGASEIYNLAGGIFNWHNQKRPLMSVAGPTDRVHPYNWWWARLVERRSLASYELPKPTTAPD